MSGDEASQDLVKRFALDHSLVVRFSNTFLRHSVYTATGHGLIPFDVIPFCLSHFLSC